MLAASAMISSASAGVEAPIVIAGAGLHGAALAYYLTRRGEKPLIIDRAGVASAASGKGGGFLARDWGSGPTAALHRVSFALHEQLANDLDITSYRRIPVLSVTPGKRNKRTDQICPWLDGEYARCEYMDKDGGAQVSPKELCEKLVAAALEAGAEYRQGSVEGIETDAAQVLTGVRVDGETIAASKFVVTMGPWSTIASDWFSMDIPMTGIKSTSIVFKAKEPIEPFALFCGDDARYGTHLEVYPRSSGEVYICGIGGSEYVTDQMLRAGAYPPGEVHADPARVEAAKAAFGAMTTQFGEPEVVQACMRPCPPDAMPLMGAIPNVHGAYMSAGHNCWGILWAPVSGKAMSELLLDGATSCVPIDAFRPDRFNQRKQGGRGRKRVDQDVGEQW